MAIKVQWDPKTGAPFAVCETPEEAMQLLKHSGPSVMNGSGRHSSNAEPTKTQVTEEKIDTVFSVLNGKAKLLLGTLLKYPSGVEGDDFGKASGIKPSGLGGVLGTISKAAKKSHLNVDQLVQSEAKFDGKRRYRWLAPTKLLVQYGDRLKMT
jgi:hypothetical protein